jgi:hypothetical protein
VDSERVKWRRFEDLVATIQAALAKDAVVTPNDKVIGTLTGVPRQIDVSVRQKAGQFELLIVIDCKDYRRPVDVKDVEEFIGLVQDVGANKGAMVAPNGLPLPPRHEHRTQASIFFGQLILGNTSGACTRRCPPFVSLGS